MNERNRSIPEVPRALTPREAFAASRLERQRAALFTQLARFVSEFEEVEGGAPSKTMKTDGARPEVLDRSIVLELRAESIRRAMAGYRAAERILDGEA